MAGYTRVVYSPGTMVGMYLPASMVDMYLPASMVGISPAPMVGISPAPMGRWWFLSCTRSGGPFHVPGVVYFSRFCTFGTHLWPGLNLKHGHSQTPLTRSGA